MRFRSGAMAVALRLPCGERGWVAVGFPLGFAMAVVFGAIALSAFVVTFNRGII